MKINLLLLVLGIATLFSCNKYPGKAGAGSGSASLKSEIDSVSYCIGMDLADMVMKSRVEEINMAAFVEGFVKVLNNDTTNLKIKVSQTREKISAFIQKIQEKRNEKNKKDGEAFLAENKKKSGVKVTASGIQYVVIKEGNGPIPNDSSDVKVHYHGTLIDGTVFDSSVDRKQAAEFNVRQVVPGWQEILKMMPVGSKWKVFIPQELAYGARGMRGSKIEPFMPLIFEMELLEILPKKAPESPDMSQISPTQTLKTK